MFSGLFSKFFGGQFSANFLGFFLKKGAFLVLGATLTPKTFWGIFAFSPRKYSVEIHQNSMELGKKSIF